MTQTGHWRLTSRIEWNTSQHSLSIIIVQWSGPTCLQFIQNQHTILLMYPQLKMPHCKFWKKSCRTKPQELVNARKVSQCAVKQAQICCVCLMMQHDTQWVFRFQHLNSSYTQCKYLPHKYTHELNPAQPEEKSHRRTHRIINNHKGQQRISVFVPESYWSNNENKTVAHSGLFSFLCFVPSYLLPPPACNLEINSSLSLLRDALISKMHLKERGASREAGCWRDLRVRKYSRYISKNHHDASLVYDSSIEAAIKYNGKLKQNRHHIIIWKKGDYIHRTSQDYIQTYKKLGKGQQQQQQVLVINSTCLTDHKHVWAPL